MVYCLAGFCYKGGLYLNDTMGAILQAAIIGRCAKVVCFSANCFMLIFKENRNSCVRVDRRVRAYDPASEIMCIIPLSNILSLVGVKLIILLTYSDADRWSVYGGTHEGKHIIEFYENICCRLADTCWPLTWYQWCFVQREETCELNWSQSVSNIHG